MYGVKYFEASAKTGEGVNGIFEYLVGAIKTKFGIMQSVTSSKLVS